MKYIQVDHRFIIISEDKEVESKITLIGYADPNAKITVYDTLEEIEI